MSKRVCAAKGTYLLEVHNDTIQGSLLVLDLDLFESDLLALNFISILAAKISVVEYFEPSLPTENQIFKFYGNEWNLVMTRLLYEPESMGFSVYLMEPIYDL